MDLKVEDCRGSMLQAPAAEARGSVFNSWSRPS